MKVLTSRTRQEMEVAAELRVAGATWETIAAELDRHVNVVARWAAHYRDEWETMVATAEWRATKRADPRGEVVLRGLLRHADEKLRRMTAAKLARRRLDELAAEGPPDPRIDVNAYLAAAAEMSDEELNESIEKFLAERGAGHS